MPAYENKSFEELRFEDYQRNNKGPTGATGFGGMQQTTSFGQPSAQVGMFGAPQTQTTGGFGFGATQPTTGFGQAATTIPAFGQQTSTLGQTGGMFGQQTQTTQPLFGQQTQPAFGQQTTGGMFGQTQTPAFGQTQPTFGQAQTSVSSPFAAKTTTGFGGFGQQPTTTGFGQQPTTGFGQQTTTGFGQQPTTGFGQQPATGFGQQATTGFGQQATTGFGGFGQQPTTTGFGQQLIKFRHNRDSVSSYVLNNQPNNLKPNNFRNSTNEITTNKIPHIPKPLKHTSLPPNPKKNDLEPPEVSELQL